MITIIDLLVLSAILFGIGIFGILTRKNAVVIFMSIEIMLNAVNISFLGFARQFAQVDGVILSFFVIAVAAAEAVIGLAIILNMHWKKNSVFIDQFNQLKE